MNKGLCKILMATFNQKKIKILTLSPNPNKKNSHSISKYIDKVKKKMRN